MYFVVLDFVTMTFLIMTYHFVNQYPMRVITRLGVLFLLVVFAFLLFRWRPQQQDYGAEGHRLLAGLHKQMLVSQPINCSLLTLLDQWATADHVLPEDAPLGHVTACLRSLPLMKANLSGRGSQLKLELTLEGGLRALFKPKRYSIETRVRGLYAGFDRHNGEVVG